jgi:alpha-mannosidase/mannosylglycerate hydrolase
MARRVHYVLSTHWDREWHHTFQDFRYRLVQLVDRILAGWQDGRLLGPFQTDGQTILIEDYLEIRPERRSEIEQRAQEGLLVIGPWYVMPDEFLVSGESLLRNLRLGRDTARHLGGKPSKAGFMCDIFGHNSQMPQIFAGFGITGAFVWRGVNLYDQRHFIWRGADSTPMPTYHFPWNGYCTYAVEVRAAQTGNSYSDEEIAARLEAHLQEEARLTSVDPILAFDGGDHMEWDVAAYAVLARRFALPDDCADKTRPLHGESSIRNTQYAIDFELLHSSLDAYLDELKPEIGKIMALREGELRDPGLKSGRDDQQWLIPGVTSSRVWIKQDNAACESLLCQWAEPFSAFAQRVLATNDQASYLNAAWKWLISNHPHDSMCGCSIDAVHEDMRYRFAQARGIANRLALEATRTLAASVSGVPDGNELRVVVFNPLPRPFHGITNLTLDAPLDWPVRQGMPIFEIRPTFRILTADGIELSYQHLGHNLNCRRTRMFDTAFPQSYRVNEIQVALPLDIPALGYTTLTIRPMDEQSIHHPETPGLATSERSLENEFLALTVETNGSLTLTDKRSNQIYTRLLTFEDRADIGDGWNHGIAGNDQVFTTTASRAAVALIHNGPQLATLRVRTVLEMPPDFDFNEMKRSNSFAGLVIDSIVTLRAGSAQVEVETCVHNTLRDHRLRVLFPSGARQAQTYLVDTPFDVVERPIALRADNHSYREPEVETKPQQSWFGVYAESRGLAVISSGLLESAVLDQPERSLALTLLRATRHTVNTDDEPLGQLQGTLTFRYWIVPLSGEPDRTSLCEAGQRLAGGLRVVQLTTLDCQQHRRSPELPLQAGFLVLEGKVVLTSLRQVNGGLEARFFNPTPTHQRARLDLNGWPAVSPAPRSACPVDFESYPLGLPEPLIEGQIRFALGPKQIMTLKLE